jgi:hypothetical protein
MTPEQHNVVQDVLPCVAGALGIQHYDDYIGFLRTADPCHNQTFEFIKNGFRIYLEDYRQLPRARIAEAARILSDLYGFRFEPGVYGLDESGPDSIPYIEFGFKWKKKNGLDRKKT